MMLRFLAVAVWMGAAASVLGADTTALQPGVKFRDCPSCPEMVVLPAGKFPLAIPTSPMANGMRVPPAPIEIAISRPFAIGVYDVTRAQYAEFVKETGYSHAPGCQMLDGARWMTDPTLSWKNPGFRQTARDPVVCVSWEDAQAYTQWLNSKVRKGEGVTGPYRLPSGSEWDYAARGGYEGVTETYWGHQATHEVANYGVDHCFPCGVSKRGRDQWYFTSPVGSFPPNAFGLYDALGNVWQWTDDCYESTFTGIPPDGSVWLSGECRLRLLRGGAFNDQAPTISLVPRNPYRPSVRNYANGFRVARSID